VRHRRSKALLIGMTLSLLAAACGNPPGSIPPLTIGPTAGAQPTALLPTPVPPPDTLIVCIAEEPASLFLYAAHGASAEAVLAALYDGPVDSAAFGHQPVLLTKLPTLADGDLVVEPITVSSGEVFFDPLTLAPRNLTYNDSYQPGLPARVPGWPGHDGPHAGRFSPAAGAVLVGWAAADGGRLGLLV
jgi:hypothetical protein